MVETEYVGNGLNCQQNLAVIHIDSIAHDALLSPVYGEGYLPDDFHIPHHQESQKVLKNVLKCLEHFQPYLNSVNPS